MKSFVFIACLVTLVIMGGCGDDDGDVPTSEDVDVYVMNFDQLLTGQLVGQDGWTAHNDTLSIEAATIAKGETVSGSSSVRIDGSLVEFSEFGVYAGFYARTLGYDPIENDTPIVELSAWLNLSGTLPRLNECSGGVSVDINGSILIGIGAAEEAGIRSFIQNLSGDGVFGSVHQPGEWVHVRADLDFERRVVVAYANDEQIGEVPFTEGMESRVDFVQIDMVGAIEMTEVVSYVDDLKVVGRR